MDASGRPMRPLRPAASDAAYAAGDTMSQELARWNPHLGSADSNLLPARDRIAARVHNMADNNGWASGTLQRYVDQAIGSDFRFSWRPDIEALSLSRDWLKKHKRALESRFRAWSNDPRRYADAAEHNTLSGLMGLAFRHRFLDGESLAVAHWRPRSDFAYATAIQVIDPDRLSNPNGRSDEARLRGGVAQNDFGAATGYHIRCAHPGEYWTGQDAWTWKYLPRRTAHGRSVVLHHFEKERAAQTRGKSILTPVLEKLKMLDKYESTEMQAALVNSIFAAFIKSPFDHDMMGDALSGADSYQEGRLNFHEKSNINLAGVRLPLLYPGEEVGFTNAARPNPTFPEFEKTALRYIAAATGQSYEQLAQDWSSTNYSSARAALMEAWKFLSARRGAFADGFATPIFALWMEEDMDLGHLDLPAGTPTFWENPTAWTRGKWTGAPRGWVDPTKEITASQMRMDAGMSTLRDECAEQGQDYEEVLEQRRHEMDLMADLNLPRPGWADAPIMGEDDPADPDDADRAETNIQAVRRSPVPEIHYSGDA